MKKIDNLLGNQPIIINIGLKSFFEALEKQDAQVVHIEWKPPAHGDPELIDLLNKLL